MRVRIATFNVENLFARFKFNDAIRPEDAIRDGWTTEDTHFEPYDASKRKLTARVIKAMKADVLVLQEVENMDALKKFNSDFLSSMDYRHKALIDGNDPRRIDVAVLSRYPITHIRSNQHLRTKNNRAWLFSRDCLEVRVAVPATDGGDSALELPILVNHFKSMMGGRDRTMSRRKVQAQGVVDILKERFGEDPGRHDWVVLGDLNDYLPSDGLAPLFDQSWVVNAMARITPKSNRWTHYWAKGQEYTQIDHILLSRALAAKNPGAVPVIERRGMPLRARRATGGRFPGVGQDRPKASDHCGVVIEIDF